MNIEELDKNLYKVINLVLHYRLHTGDNFIVMGYSDASAILRDIKRTKETIPILSAYGIY